MPRNSPGATVKLTRSTARTSTVLVAYSTERSATSSRGSATPSPPAPALDRPQSRISDLVEGVVQQREAGAQQGDRAARRQRPPRVSGLQGRGLLCVVEHRSPHQ